MSLKEEIDRLEKELMLKKAYLAVKIEFGGQRFTPEIEEEVQYNLMEAAEKLAAGGSTGATPSTGEGQLALTREEVEILKTMANTILATAASPRKSTGVVETEPPAPKKQQNRGTLLNTEGVPGMDAHWVTIGMRVSIIDRVKKDGDDHFVIQVTEGNNVATYLTLAENVEVG